jgi:hypothetical protein
MIDIFAPWDWAALDWGFQKTSTGRDCKVAALPIKFNDPNSFCYIKEYADIDLSSFELILLSDIEFESISAIQQWIKQNKINNFCLTLGGLRWSEKLDPSCMIYRPWWAFNLFKYNNYLAVENYNKPYLFEALLGARRPHRDFIMLGLEQNNLLDNNIVTYRDIFYTGGYTDHQTDEFARIFPKQKLKYPYVSQNLNTNWEVGDQIDKTISRYVPWKIYQQTWYSIVAETIGTGDCFFMSEKTAKCLFAGRLFVMFGNANFLQGLKNLGFETFGSVIDESYDVNLLDFARFQQALQQVVYLSTQDPKKIYQKIKPILDHNRNRLLIFEKEFIKQQQDMLKTKLNY